MEYSTINDLIRLKIVPCEISDEFIKKSSYGIEFFSFYGDVSQTDIDYWIETRPILLNRLKSLLKTQNITLNIVSVPSGQIWEKCSHCRNEPVYLEYDELCEDCWKRRLEF